LYLSPFTFFITFYWKKFTLVWNSNLVFFQQIICDNLSHELKNIMVCLCSYNNLRIHDDVYDFTSISVWK
jgi:hypothetical protein